LLSQSAGAKCDDERQSDDERVDSLHKQHLSTPKTSMDAQM
jgi:hypothetical protein